MRHPAANTAVRATSKRIARSGGSHPEIERLESVLGELSAAMARASAHEIDREIDHWLGEICEALDLDRSALYERSAPGHRTRLARSGPRIPEAAFANPGTQETTPESNLRTRPATTETDSLC